jgi:hypothetical protein
MRAKERTNVMKGKDEHIRKESNIFSSPNQKNLR